jgi:hypothetical protein
MKLLGFLGRHQPDSDEVERADEPIADAEAARADNRVPQRNRPVMLQQDEGGRGVIGNVFEHVPLTGVAEHVDSVGRGFLGARFRAGLQALFTLDAEADERADLAS